ncbi:MAG: putative cytochrome c-554 [Candidatus Scalindua rubra]|uniref:Putative cytochrome c-554 n=1 Tax=Candidatus Scalindua rubra TaxID=1872076 RepID=A0A1E3XFP3_9BACT|nr:MAG: putative cytochrome c-554 [Candidatus Scalindua rubra]
MIRIISQFLVFTTPIVVTMLLFFSSQIHNILYGKETHKSLKEKSLEFTVQIAFTGEENGYLEPCGCSENEIGGLPRRQTLINLLKKYDENCILLSLGDLPNKVGRQDEIKMETILKALDQMGYVAHNIGEKDINMGLELLSYLSQINNINLISSNIVTLNTEVFNIKPYVIKEIETKERILKIGILGILSPKLIDDNHQYIEVMDPVESLKPLLSNLNKETDILLLLSHAEMEYSIQLAETFPEFDLVISGHRIDNPDLYFKKVKDTYVIPVGEKGKYLGTITISLKYSQTGKVKNYNSYLYNRKLEYHGLDDERKEPAIEIIPLDKRYEDSHETKRLLKIYQQRLIDEELIKKVFKIYPPSDLTFIGNDDCAICHNKIFKHWENTRHALAYETLLKVEHEYDPECLSCHTTGLYYFTGFETIESTPRLRGVGCESCHGPGSAHKETQSKDYGKVNTNDCIICHENEHSPNFQFEDYWQKIVHPPEDKLHNSYK